MPRTARAAAFAAISTAVCLAASSCSSPAGRTSAAPPTGAPSSAPASVAAAGSASSSPWASPSASASTRPPAEASGKSTVPTSGGAGAAGAPDQVLTAQPIDLAQWQLILPVSSSGASSGTDAAVEHPAGLDSPWLTRQSNGSLLFWAPAAGATTGHSLHARTELDFLSAFTAGSGDHSLTATVVAEQLPTQSHDIVIGQLHGSGSTYSAAPFVELEFNGSKLTAAVESKPKLQGSLTAPNGEVTSTYTVLTGLALGDPVAYTITADGDELTFTAELYSRSGAKEENGSVSVAIPSAWKGVPVNFDAGDYEQDDASAAPSGGGKIAFYRLSAE